MTDMVEQAGEAEKALTERRVATARSLWEKALSQHPEHGCFLHYNLGALHFWATGDGVSARHHFLQSLEARPRGLTGPPKNVFDNLEANACENMMLLSLSYEEYDRWAGRLRKLEPDNEILKVQLPHISGIRDRGASWGEAMAWIASTYMSGKGQGPGGGGRFGNMAATYHLLVENRRQLRLSRQQYRSAVLGLSAACMALVAEGDQIMRRTCGQSDPREFAFPFETVLPVAEEFLAANPSDDKAREVVDHLREGIEIGRRAPTRSTPPGPMEPDIGTAPGPRAGKALIGAVLGGVAGFVLARLAPPEAGGEFGPWLAVFFGALVGAQLGLIDHRQALPKFLKKVLGIDVSEWFGQPGTVAGESVWQTSSALRRAIAGIGLEGMQFSLKQVSVEDGGLLLVFQAFGSKLPRPDRAHEAGLALRCIVWLTFPQVAARAADIEVIQEPGGMGVRLGDGVPMPTVAIRRANHAVGPFQVISDEQTEILRFVCQVVPLVRDFGMSVTRAADPVLLPVAEEFKKLRQQPVVLRA